jgi:hypothetical protein
MRGYRYKKGNIPWNKGRPWSQEIKQKFRESRKGKGVGRANPFYGKHHTEDVKRKISLANKGRISAFKGKHHTEESKRKLSASHKGKTPWNKGKPFLKGKQNPMYGRRRSDFARRYGRKDEFEAKRLKAVCKKPTLPESRFIEIIRRHDLPYRYTGNGSVIIGGKNPDFIATNGTKQVVEIFGNYWHNPSLNPLVDLDRTYDFTVEHYQRHGFNCVIIWENELEDNNLVLKRLCEKVESSSL